MLTWATVTEVLVQVLISPVLLGVASLPSCFEVIDYPMLFVLSLLAISGPVEASRLLFSIAYY